MNKLFKPRCLRRIFLCLALMFPIVYLCGGLFFALAGAHGEQIFAEPVYVEDYVEVNLISGEGDYRLSEIGDVEDLLSGANFNIDFDTGATFNSYSMLSLTKFPFNDTYYLRVVTPNFYLDIATINNGTYTENNRPWTFYSNEKISRFVDFLDLYEISYKLEKFMLVPSSYVSENNSAYTDFIFSQPFAKDNFITSLGKDLVDGSTKGFNPMNQLFRTINSNIMHFENTDGLAMFGFGYVYYAVNVLIIYEILVLAVKLIMLPLKAVDVFDKEDI